MPCNEGRIDPARASFRDLWWTVSIRYRFVIVAALLGGLLMSKDLVTRFFTQPTGPISFSAICAVRFGRFWRKAKLISVVKTRESG